MTEKKQLYHIATEADKAKRENAVKKKDPEEKQYLVCIKAISNYDYGNSEWEICFGRTEAREYIKSCIDYIDFDHSFVLVESCNLTNRKSIYAFMKYIEPLYHDGFDIDDYVRGDWSEEDYDTNNSIDTSIYNHESMTNGVTMEQIMDGETNTIPLDE